MSSESEKIRAERKRQRELKNARKEELSGATSASERRKIKAKYSEPKANVNEGRSEGNSYDSMSQREAASGLYDTTVGRDSFYDSDIEPSVPESPSEEVLYPDVDSNTNNPFTLDIVRDDNTTGTATFIGPGVD